MLKDIGGKIYCSIVCVKSLAEQVRKCCLLPSVSFQCIFLSESRSNRYNATKVWRGIQGSRRSPVHLSFMPAILRWLRVTLPRRTRTPRQKGLVTPGLALTCSKAFPLCFSLHRRETRRLPTWEQTTSFLGVQDPLTSVCCSSRKHGNVYLSRPRMITALQAACFLVG